MARHKQKKRIFVTDVIVLSYNSPGKIHTHTHATHYARGVYLGDASFRDVRAEQAFRDKLLYVRQRTGGWAAVSETRMTHERPQRAKPS